MAADEAINYPRISLEEVIRRKPEVILILRWREKKIRKSETSTGYSGLPYLRYKRDGFTYRLDSSTDLRSV